MEVFSGFCFFKSRVIGDVGMECQMFYFDFSFIEDCQLYEGIYDWCCYGFIDELFDGMIFGDFCDEYFYERILCDLLFLVENSLVVYLVDDVFVILRIVYLCEGIGVEVQLYDLLQVVVCVLYVKV